MDEEPMPDADPTLIVIGAGPKALAIASKRAVLARLGFSVPELIVIDKDGVAAGWSGEFGLTDGSPLLGTRPEKDVGFPYDSSVWGKMGAYVDEEMTAFSWQRYLIATGGYSDWIDRRRPQPTHRAWSRYLQWVAARLQLRVRLEEIREITTGDGRWRLSCSHPEHQDTFLIEGDGLVITGPGSPLRVPGQPPAHRRVMDGDTFWTYAARLAHIKCPISVAVVGTGETAAAIAVALVETLHERSSIEIISARGVPYSRGESFEESRLFSNPGAEWGHLTKHHRREFIQRTDRGVFSIRAQETIEQAENVRSLPGEIAKVQASDDNVLVDIRYGDETERAAYDYVIVAIGFDALSFQDLCDHSTRRRFEAALGGWGRQVLEQSIEFDLSVANWLPRLHLPMLAGLSQGPGFPNLSCLGLVSDRILSAYVRPPGKLNVPAMAHTGERAHGAVMGRLPADWIRADGQPGSSEGVWHHDGR
jgi:mycobactin lysine-N-oxygenase